MTAPVAGAAAVARLAGVPWRALPDGIDAAIAEVLAGAAGERVLDRFLRARRALGRDGRAAAAEAVFGVGLWRRRLAWELGDDGGDPSRRSPRELLAALLRDLAGLPADEAERLTGAVLPAPRAARADGSRRAPADLALRWSFPDWLADELRAAVVDAGAADAEAEADALAAALSTPGPVCLRANRARGTREALAARLAADGVATRPCRWAADGLEVTSPRPNLLGARALREGDCEVQDEGSQLVGELAGAPGGEVLDLCAGRGGKSLQLAALGARVHACDPDGARLARLRERAARAGADVVLHGASPPPGLRVDAALVDAPCSELGPLRRGPDLRFRLDPASFAALPPLQRSLLHAASLCVKSGGRLVYVTCTFRRVEDEEVARAFEREHPGYERLAAGDHAGGDALLRLLPHRHGTDGFFAAVWRRR